MEREFSEIGCYLNFTISLLEWKQPIRQVHLSQLPVCRGGPRQNAAVFVRTEWRQAQQNGEKNINYPDTFRTRLNWKVQNLASEAARLRRRTFKANSPFHKSDKLMLWWDSGHC